LHEIDELREMVERYFSALRAAGAEARDLTQGIREPESYRTHDEHRAKMRKLTFNDLVKQTARLSAMAWKCATKSPPPPSACRLPISLETLL
jgi:hypothetical protein